MYRYDFDGLHEITDDGRDEDNEYIECFTCQDMVLLKNTDEHKYYNIITRNFDYQNICTRCNDVMEDIKVKHNIKCKQ